MLGRPLKKRKLRHQRLSAPTASSQKNQNSQTKRSSILSTTDEEHDSALTGTTESKRIDTSESESDTEETKHETGQSAGSQIQIQTEDSPEEDTKEPPKASIDSSSSTSKISPSQTSKSLTTSLLISRQPPPLHQGLPKPLAFLAHPSRKSKQDHTTGIHTSRLAKTNKQWQIMMSSEDSKATSATSGTATSKRSVHWPPSDVQMDFGKESLSQDNSTTAQAPWCPSEGDTSSGQDLEPTAVLEHVAALLEELTDAVALLGSLCGAGGTEEVRTSPCAD